MQIIRILICKLNAFLYGKPTDDKQVLQANFFQKLHQTEPGNTNTKFLMLFYVVGLYYWYKFMNETSRSEDNS